MENRLRKKYLLFPQFLVIIGVSLRHNFWFKNIIKSIVLRITCLDFKKISINVSWKTNWGKIFFVSKYFEFFSFFPVKLNIICFSTTIRIYFLKVIHFLYIIQKYYIQKFKINFSTNLLWTSVYFFMKIITRFCL